MLWLVFYLCLVSKLSLAAEVSDLNPKTDCKALLAQKADERAKNPDLVLIPYIISHCLNPCEQKKKRLSDFKFSQLWSVFQTFRKFQKIFRLKNDSIFLKHLLMTKIV